MADKRKSSYSWKTPWAFNSFYQMRRTLTERYVYKKLGVLERHSTWKKPYRQRSPHKIGELLYSGSGGDPIAGGGPIDPPGGTGCAGASMACLGGMLDCKDGGCDIIVCICGVPPYDVRILDDPTGEAWTTGGVFPQICIPATHIDLEYGEITVEVFDGNGQRYVTTHPLVDCAPCCETYTLSGDPTINKSTTWFGTIDPPCEDATVVVTSNSGCTLEGTVSGSGSTVSVPIGANDCGSFTVTVSFEEDDCDSKAASITVRINADGQGGAWVVEEADWCSNQANCGTDCGVGCTGGACPDVQPFNQAAVTDGQYKYGEPGGPTHCQYNFDQRCVYNANGAGTCAGMPPGASRNEDCDDGCTCYGCWPYEYSNDWWWHCDRCEWECSC